MGITRSSEGKRRATGARKKSWRKKRKYNMGRPPALTKLSQDTRIRPVRVRGGNLKFRALRLHQGNFSWGSECISRKTRILDVVYNASNNELVRTKTLVKNAIVYVDSTPFRQYFEQFYGITLGKKSEEEEVKPLSKRLAEKHEKRKEKAAMLDPAVKAQFLAGRLLCCISSRPGQVGRADGYILEGPELVFYQRKVQQKKGKS